MNNTVTKKAKNFIEACNLRDKDLSFQDFAEALDQYRKAEKYNFDESIDLEFALNIVKQDQMVKTSVVLKNGNGKKVKILAITEEHIEELEKIGVQYAGIDYIDQIISGSLVPGKDFTSCVASTAAMQKLLRSKAVKTLGQAGMMPNVKVGTVGPDIVSLCKEVLAGKAILKNDKTGIIRLSIGKLSFSNEKIIENISCVYEALKAAKPETIKANFFKSCKVSSSMMPFSLNIKMSSLYGSDK